MKTIIHVDQHALRAYRKDGEVRPPITVKTYKSNIRAISVDIKGPCKVIFSPDKPLPCGAKVWIETEAEVEGTGIRT